MMKENERSFKNSFSSFNFFFFFFLSTRIFLTAWSSSGADCHQQKKQSLVKGPLKLLFFGSLPVILFWAWQLALSSTLRTLEHLNT